MTPTRNRLINTPPRTQRAVAALLLAFMLVQPLAAVAQSTPPAPAPAAAPSVAPPPSEPAPAGPSLTTPPATPPSMMVELPRDLSPWGMFMAADIVVKAVMIGLVFASVLTWTIWMAKTLELTRARARLRRAIAALGAARAWEDAVAAMRQESGSAAHLVHQADAELRISSEVMAPHTMSPEGVKERIASRLERAEAGAARAMLRGTSLLGTIGATAPFVGLFGTVWGIMNSFIGISKSQTTNLAVVAPGIAEALLATALGLVAAIPAVMMYNFFSRWIAGYRAMHADVSAEIMRLVGRDLDRGAFDRRPRAAAAE